MTQPLKHETKLVFDLLFITGFSTAQTSSGSLEYFRSVNLSPLRHVLRVRCVFNPPTPPPTTTSRTHLPRKIVCKAVHLLEFRIRLDFGTQLRQLALEFVYRVNPELYEPRCELVLGVLAHDSGVLQRVWIVLLGDEGD